MNKRIWGIVIALILAIGLVMLPALRTPTLPLPPPVKLPDGSTVRIVKVSYGTKHFGPDVWWHSWARRLPRAAQDWIELPVALVMKTHEPSLAVWWSCENRFDDTRWGHGYGIEDEGGAEMPAAFGNNMRHSMSSSGGPYLCGGAFAVFPRRGSMVTLHSYYRAPTGRNLLAASFKIPNPVPHKYPEWQPQSLPAIATNGDVKIECQRLLVGVTRDDPPGVSRVGDWHYARADFRVVEKDEASERWLPTSIEQSDATGNFLPQYFSRQGVRAGEAYLTWGHFLWPNESAWKIRVAFWRNLQAGFTTNELIVVKGLAVPAKDSVTLLNLVTNRLGHAVQVLGLSSGNGYIPDHSRIRISDPVRIQAVVPRGLPNKRLALVGVRDDQGRPVERLEVSDKNGSFSFGCKPEPDAKSLDFTLAFHDTITVEFLVKPEQFDPAKSVGK